MSTVVTILVAPLFVAVAALLYAFAVRRLLALRVLVTVLRPNND